MHTSRQAHPRAWQVAYWNELTSFFERVKETDASLLSLCWGAMASLYYFHKVLMWLRLHPAQHHPDPLLPQVPKYITPRKQFGVFPHANLAPTNILMQAPRPSAAPPPRARSHRRARAAIAARDAQHCAARAAPLVQRGTRDVEPACAGCRPGPCRDPRR
jgi:hypothetical protein